MKNWMVGILMVLSASVFGQKGWEIGGWLGTAWYQGDITPTFDVSQIGPAGGAIFRRNFNNRISLTSSFTLSRVHGKDSKANNNFQLQRNLNFASSIFEWSPYIEFNFFNYNHGSYDAAFTPYVYLGFNVFRFNPKSLHGDSKVALQPLGTEGQTGNARYRRVTGGIAYGIGLKSDINRNWSINAIINVRSTFTDYLDDVSGVYANAQQIRDVSGDEGVYYANPSTVDGFGAEGTQRGNAKNKDTYYFFSLGIVRYFGRIECPETSKIR